MSTYAAVGAVGLSLQRLLDDRLDMPPAPTGTVVTVGNPPTSRTPRRRSSTSSSTASRRTARSATSRPATAASAARTGIRRSRSTSTTSSTRTGRRRPPGRTRFRTRSSRTTCSAARCGSSTTIRSSRPRSRPAAACRCSTRICSRRDEAVKITLDPLSLEDLSKVWTALSKPFRPSAAYEVSVVQIDSKLRTPNVLPVGPLDPDDRAEGASRRPACRRRSPTCTPRGVRPRRSASARHSCSRARASSATRPWSPIDGLDDVAQVTSAREDRLTVPSSTTRGCSRASTRCASATES